ncbi:MAG: ATP-grasp domain-containing protein [Cellulosilyticaceae bacterium]
MVAGKKIMILGASELQVQEILTAKKLGCIVYAVDQDEQAAGFRYADESYAISTMDTPRIVELAQQLKIDGILTLSDQPVLSVAAVGESLNLATISTKAALYCTNKSKMRQILKKANVSIPKFQKVSMLAEYLEASKNFSIPFIVKPVDNAGSRGVFLVEKEVQREAAFIYSKAYSRSGEVIIEAYMEGPEVSVETLAIDGVTHIIAITDKITTGAPCFVEIGHTIPSAFENNILEEVRAITLKAHKALGVTYGPTHTEIKITSEGPKIIEVGARLGGDHITGDLVPLATGVNMIEACIYLALKENYPLPTIKMKGAAIRFLESRAGIIKEIQGINILNLMPEVKKVYQYKQIGEITDNPHNSGDRVMGVIVQGENGLAASLQCEKALSKIQVIYE